MVTMAGNEHVGLTYRANVSGLLSLRSHVICTLYGGDTMQLDVAAQITYVPLYGSSHTCASMSTIQHIGSSR